MRIAVRSPPVVAFNRGLEYRDAMKSAKSQGLGIAATAVILALLITAAPFLQSAQVAAFCLPAAKATSFVLGGDIAPAESGGYTVFTVRGPIQVTTACSAFRFFSITLAILSGMAIQRKRYKLLPVALITAYGVTLVANVARIVSARYARIIADAMLPPEMLRAVHMGTGLVCFLLFLLITYTVAERMMRHEEAPA
jgi:exosortase K